MMTKMISSSGCLCLACLIVVANSLERMFRMNKYLLTLMPVEWWNTFSWNEIKTWNYRISYPCLRLHSSTEWRNCESVHRWHELCSKRPSTSSASSPQTSCPSCSILRLSECKRFEDRHAPNPDHTTVLVQAGLGLMNKMRAWSDNLVN